MDDGMTDDERRERSTLTNKEIEAKLLKLKKEFELICLGQDDGFGTKQAKKAKNLDKQVRLAKLMK